MDFNFKRNATCFGELPYLANSPIGWGEGEVAESIDMGVGVGVPFGEVFPIEDLSEFSNEDIAGPIPCANISSSSLSSASSETHGIWASFAGDDMGVFTPFCEGEWLSDFAEDSFVGTSFADSSIITNELDPHPEEKRGDLSKENLLGQNKRVVPRRARSKRSRAQSLCGWSYERAPCKPEAHSQQPRRCTHCLSQRTPQWRAGPLGPKTLCNACGVRFKSGRLFPEYRPAKSPSFLGSIHSNSHKKVLEMRGQLTQVEQPHQPFKLKFRVVGADEFSCGSN